MNSSLLKSPGNTEGFDEFAGQRWIYPDNMPIRSYQKQAVEKALFHNAMIVLPTGFGKTFIAAVVMYNFYLWYPSGKIIFVAPTKPLVAQQIQECKKICGFPSKDCLEMTGTIASARRADLWKQKRVFFATPQVIENDLENSILPAKDVKCLVVDEAHRAQGGYAYVGIVRQLHDRNRNGFRILALSATPGSDIERVKQVMLNLYISEVMFRSENSIDLLQYKNEKNSKAWLVEISGSHKRILDKYIEITKPIFTDLHKAGLTYNGDSVEKVAKYTLLKAQSKIDANLAGSGRRGKLKYLCYAGVSLSHHFELMALYGLRVFYSSVVKNFAETKSTMKTVLASDYKFDILMSEIKEMFGDDVEPDATKSSERDLLLGHPKLRAVKELLITHFEENKDKGETRAMIFSKYRESVYDITQVLKRFEPVIKPAPFVGQGGGTKASKSKGSGSGQGMSQREQIKLISDFKAGIYNVLVATCVAEEGLDIGEIDLIICYDTTSSPISSTQRRGRTGRKRFGAVQTLLTKGYEEKRLKSASSSRRQVEDQLFKRENYMTYRYRDAPRMVPKGVSPAFFPQKIEPVCDPEDDADSTQPKRKRRSRKADINSNTEDTPKLKKCKGFEPKSIDSADEFDDDSFDDMIFKKLNSSNGNLLSSQDTKSLEDSGEDEAKINKSNCPFLDSDTEDKIDWNDEGSRQSHESKQDI